MAVKKWDSYPSNKIRKVSLTTDQDLSSSYVVIGGAGLAVLHSLGYTKFVVAIAITVDDTTDGILLQLRTGPTDAGGFTKTLSNRTVNAGSTNLGDAVQSIPHAANVDKVYEFTFSGAQEFVEFYMKATTPGDPAANVSEFTVYGFK